MEREAKKGCLASMNLEVKQPYMDFTEFIGTLTLFR